jgi:hypothetical protein
MTSEGAHTPASEAPFDREALRIIRSSAISLAHMEAEFIARLHKDIVALSPNVAVQMADAGRPFCERMAQALIWVALTDEPPNVIAGVLRQVGADNYLEGFRSGDYVSVAHALVRAIRDLTDSEWVTSMGSAWISCFMWMQPHLVAGARQAAVAPATRSLAEQSLAPAPQPQPTPTPEPAPQPTPEPAPGPAAEPASDDDEIGYGQLMVSMTLNPRRDR